MLGATCLVMKCIACSVSWQLGGSLQVAGQGRQAKVFEG